MQVILGSGGDIGKPLAKALRQYTSHVRLASRNPQKLHPDDELMPTDILAAADVCRAVKGAEVVYCTVGFEYKLKVWKSSWPLAMKNIINACLEHGARLVFFDNVYMYAKNDIGHMTEAVSYTHLTLPTICSV